MSVLIEAVATSPDDARIAAESGADRVELCAALPTGGTTPTPGMFVRASEICALPIACMVRPREGGFVYSEDEFSSMLYDARMLSEMGAEGLVVAALTDENQLALSRLRKLKTAAGEATLVFHRAFDLIADQHTALKQLIDLGFSRILTTGGKPTALEGVSELAQLIALADGRIEILVGGGVRPGNVKEIVEKSGAKQVHLGPRKPSGSAAGGMYGVHDVLDGDATAAIRTALEVA